MDQKYIDEIKAREQAATLGPWKDPWYADTEEDADRICDNGGNPVVSIDEDGHLLIGSTDSWFICNARTDIPALIAEVERLTAENKNLYALAGKMNVVDLVRENCRLANALNHVEVDVSGQKEQNATLKKALELEARHMVSLVSTSDCKMKENSEYCSSTISCTECIQQHFIKQAQQLTHEMHGDDKSAVTSITCYGEGEDFE